jgi:hypothetical protein
VKKACVILIALMIMFSSSAAFAAPDEVDVAFDALIFRPIGVAVLVGGSVTFIITLPIAAITKSVPTTAEVFVENPFKYTFTRPIGDMRAEL